MSKRSGTYIAGGISEVGRDAARFFCHAQPDSHLDFDLDLARKNLLLILFIMCNMLMPDS